MYCMTVPSVFAATHAATVTHSSLSPYNCQFENIFCLTYSCCRRSADITCHFNLSRNHWEEEYVVFLSQVVGLKKISVKDLQLPGLLAFPTDRKFGLKQSVMLHLLSNVSQYTVWVQARGTWWRNTLVLYMWRNKQPRWICEDKNTETWPASLIYQFDVCHVIDFIITTQLMNTDYALSCPVTFSCFRQMYMHAQI